MDFLYIKLVSNYNLNPLSKTFFDDDVILHHIHSNFKFAILHIISTIVSLVQLMLHSVFKFPLRKIP